MWFTLWSIYLHNRPAHLFAVFNDMVSVKTMVALISCLLLQLSAWEFCAAWTLQIYPHDSNVSNWCVHTMDYNVVFVRLATV